METEERLGQHGEFPLLPLHRGLSSSHCCCTRHTCIQCRLCRHCCLQLSNTIPPCTTAFTRLPFVSLVALPAPSAQAAVFDVCDAVAVNKLAMRQPIRPVTPHRGNTPLRKPRYRRRSSQSRARTSLRTHCRLGWRRRRCTQPGAHRELARWDLARSSEAHP